MSLLYPSCSDLDVPHPPAADTQEEQDEVGDEAIADSSADDSSVSSVSDSSVQGAMRSRFWLFGYVIGHFFLMLVHKCNFFRIKKNIFGTHLRFHALHFGGDESA